MRIILLRPALLVAGAFTLLTSTSALAQEDDFRALRKEIDSMRKSFEPGLGINRGIQYLGYCL